MSVSNTCPACGSANAPTSTFCVNCGTRLGISGPVPPVAPPAGLPPVSPPPYPGYPPPAYPYFPGPPPRAANFSNILSGMFDVWTKNLADFFLVYLVLAIISTLLGVLIVFAAFGTFEPGGGIIPGSPPAGVPTVDVGALLLYAAAAVVASVILNSIVTGGMTEYAVRRYRGESMTVGQALRRGIQRFLSILGATILLTLLLFGFILLPLLFLLTLAGAASSGSAGGVIAVICGLVIALIVGGILVIFVLVSMSLYAPAIMMENASAIEGLSRSWNLTKGHRLSIFGAVLVAGLLIFVISAVITLPASFVRNPIASIVASALASAIVGPWFAILVAVAYDLIVRPFGSMPSYVPGPTPPPVP